MSTKIQQVLEQSGIIYLICHKSDYEKQFKALLTLGCIEENRPVSIAEYKSLLANIKDGSNSVVAIPNLFQMPEDLELVFNDTMDRIRFFNVIINEFVTVARENNMKLVSVLTVPDEYDLVNDRSGLASALNMEAEKTHYISNFTATLYKDDAHVIRDKHGPSGERIEKLFAECKDMAKEHSIPFIHIKSSSRHNEFILAGETSGNDTMLTMNVVKERDASSDIVNIPNFSTGPDMPEENGNISNIKKSGPYESPRGMMLLAQTPSDKPILTAENYGKWYDLYLLMPDGKVVGLHDLKDIDLYDVPNLKKACPRIDHNYHPELFCKLAGNNDWYIDDMALEVAAGRWALEYGSAGFDEASYFAVTPEEC